MLHNYSLCIPLSTTIREIVNELLTKSTGSIKELPYTFCIKGQCELYKYYFCIIYAASYIGNPNKDLLSKTWQ